MLRYAAVALWGAVLLAGLVGLALTTGVVTFR
jgi:hypothetical protein